MAPNKSVQRKSYPPLENIPSVRRELVAFVGRRLALARSLYEKTVLHNDVEKHHLLLQQPTDSADRQEMKEHLVDNEKTTLRCFPRLGFADVDATVRRLLLKVKARGATLRTHFPLLYSPAAGVGVAVGVFNRELGSSSYGVNYLAFGLVFGQVVLLSAKKHVGRTTTAAAARMQQERGAVLEWSRILSSWSQQ